MIKQTQYKLIFKLEKEKILVYKVEDSPLSFKAFHNKGREGFRLDNKPEIYDKFWEWFDNVTGIVKQSDIIKGCVLINKDKTNFLESFHNQIESRGFHFVDEKDNKWLEKELKEFFKQCTPYVDVSYDKKRELFKNNDIELVIKGLCGRIDIQCEESINPNIKPVVSKKNPKKEDGLKESADPQTDEDISKTIHKVLPVRKRTKVIEEKTPAEKVETRIKDNLSSSFGVTSDESLPEMTSEDVQRYINERTKDHCRIVDFE